MPKSKKLRRLIMGLQTLFDVKPQGFFIPYRYAQSVPSGMDYPAIRALFDAARPQMASLLAAVSGLSDDLQKIGSDPPPEPRWPW